VRAIDHLRSLPARQLASAAVRNNYSEYAVLILKAKSVFSMKSKIPTLKKLLLFLVILIPAVASAQSYSNLDTLHWMLGEWQQDDGKKITTEIWTKLSPNTYEGIGQTVLKSEGKITFLESLRLIEMSGEVFYLAKVSHNEFPISFKLMECLNNNAVFENPTHDFPKKIIYNLSKDGLALNVTVSSDERQFTVEYTKFEDK